MLQPRERFSACVCEASFQMSRASERDTNPEDPQWCGHLSACGQSDRPDACAFHTLRHGRSSDHAKFVHTPPAASALSLRQLSSTVRAKSLTIDRSCSRRPAISAGILCSDLKQFLANLSLLRLLRFRNCGKVRPMPSSTYVDRIRRRRRITALFTIEIEFPKLNVAGSIPVSRSNKHLIINSLSRSQLFRQHHKTPQ